MRIRLGSGYLHIGLPWFLTVAMLCPATLSARVLSPEQADGTSATQPLSVRLPAALEGKLDMLQRSLYAAQQKGNAKSQALALIGIGDIYFAVPSYAKALESYSQALTVTRTAKSSELEVFAIDSMGGCYRAQSLKNRALELYLQALDVAKNSGDKKGEARTLNDLGAVYSDLDQMQQALDAYGRALAIYQSVKDRDGKARALNNIANLYADMGEKQKALDYLNQVIPVLHGANDPIVEATTLINIGRVYEDLGDRQRALKYYNDALPIYRTIDDRDGEASAQNDIGAVYFAQGEMQKALELFNQALPIQRATADREGEAITLSNIGQVYEHLGESQKALEFFNQALPIQRAIGDHRGEGVTHNNLGAVYHGLGNEQKALENFQSDLAIRRSTEDRDGEAITMNNIGMIHSSLNEKQSALDDYNRALTIFRSVGDKAHEGTTLNNIGSVYTALGERQKALDYLGEALPIRKSVHDREGEATTLNNLGRVYADMGEKQRALDYYNQALPIATEVSDPLLESQLYDNMSVCLLNDKPGLAIFYGKQAVNLIQQVRNNIESLDKALRNSFLASKESYYHNLANLLIDQGRLPEAQQVLDLLKQQEYSDYVRGEAKSLLSPLALTPAEKQAEDDYAKSTAQLVSLSGQWTQLRKMTARTPEQEVRYQQLSAQLDAASKGLNDYYARLYALFGNNSDANRQVADVKGEVSLLRQTIAKMPNAVAIYTLVGKDRTSLIVITSSATVAREAAIGEQDLNHKIAAFQQALRHPAGDPRPLAQDLYEALIGPIKSDLDQAHAQTLIFSLDGVLRYVPMAALYDGEHYLVEQYNTVTITPVSIPHLSEKPDVSNLSTLAMGISQELEDGLPALPSVVGELDDIVRDAHVRGANGVLPGTILLDGEFTEKAMEDSLGSQHGVVHIASHFVFKPGDDNQSYLLLAGKQAASSGYHLTVADFRDNQKLALDDTELLTLSACETGMSGDASNGREVDGLGMTAQLKGAKAVISSLWEVNDSSTGALMADFYQRWVGGAGKVEKVEALRQAQLDLLLDKTNRDAPARGRGFASETQPNSALAGYSHPYYWAPFVLMGNWR